jgi:hypothetical protein
MDGYFFGLIELSHLSGYNLDLAHLLIINHNSRNLAIASPALSMMKLTAAHLQMLVPGIADAQCRFRLPEFPLSVAPVLFANYGNPQYFCGLRSAGFTDSN